MLLYKNHQILEVFDKSGGGGVHSHFSFLRDEKKNKKHGIFVSIVFIYLEEGMVCDRGKGVGPIHSVKIA